ncbi:MAG: ribosomal protein S18-alanine N-acetyltransferase [Anaerolineales bacterium]|nr:ribosomal protein S18-alanine N-acetyltransferase [Anaerolineales bacterium]
MKIRDIPQVLAIDRASFALPWSEKSYQFEILENNASWLWVAEIQNQTGQPQIIGMIVVWLISDEAHVATIAVHPGHRQQGIARQLLARAIYESIKSGALLATLEVRQHNAAAQELYHSFGFEVVGCREHYYTDNHEDALIMTVSGLDQAYLAWLAGQTGLPPVSESRMP